MQLFGQSYWCVLVNPGSSKHRLNGCRFNSQIMVFVTHQFRSVKPCCPGAEGRADDKAGEDASACNTSMVLLNKGAAQFGPSRVLHGPLRRLEVRRVSFGRIF